jgi:serine/threonine protein kinase/Flp pilus assembly protein TadD
MNQTVSAPTCLPDGHTRASLRELVEAIMAGWAEGAEPDASAALVEHPELVTDKSLVLDLAYEEFCLRQEAGQAPDPAAFCARFPTHRTSVRELIHAHQFLEDNPPPPFATPLPDWPAPGDRVGEYTLVRELGRGAFARVFLAREASIGDRAVALKITRGGPAEAHALGRLAHPNIVPIFSAQQDDVTGLSMLCMPFLGSATLNDVLDRAFPRADSPPPAKASVILEAVQSTARPEDPSISTGRPDAILEHGAYADGVVTLGIQLAEALAFLHARPVYHCDLKPSNILLCPDGRPLLLDFNLSADAGATMARQGGTIPYMAPEQLSALGSGSASRLPVDARADLFALGVILYELSTGQHPFGPVPLTLPVEELCSWLLGRQRTGIRPLRETNPKMSRAAGQWIERCLAFDPAGRPASAAILASGLRQYFARLARFRRWATGRSKWLLGVACVAFVVACLGGWAWSQRPPYSARQYQAGRAAFQAGDYQEAVEYFSRALAAEPGHRDSRLARAATRLMEAESLQGQAARLKINEALPEFEKLALDNPNDGLVLACLAYCHSRLKDHPVAIILYQQASAAGLESAALFNNQALSYLITHELDKAEASLAEALRLDPELQAAYYNRAMLAHQRWLSDPSTPFPGSALADVERAIQIGPHTAKLFADAGALYAAAAYPGQEKLARRAIELLGQAIAMGYEHAHLAADPFVSQLNADLTRIPGPIGGAATPAHSLRLINPITELPD